MTPDRTAAATGVPTASVSATLPPTPGPTLETLDGAFEAGDHKLHLRCVGTGSPTVVYLHGLSHEPGDANGSSAKRLPDLVGEHGYRFCGYDRANTGSSDGVSGPLTGKTSAKALHALLASAGIEPPYVLLAASFGGLVADIYAATYPDDVIAMLQLDAGIPDELDLEHFFPEEDRLRHEEHGFFGWADNEEQMDEFAAYEDAYALIGKEPEIPMTFLVATPGELSGPAGYVSAYPGAIATFASRYSPGVVKEVRSAHYMEGGVPDRIVEELLAIIAAAAP